MPRPRPPRELTRRCALIYTAVPRRWFSWDFVVLDGSGRALAEIDMAVFGERATVAVEGSTYEIAREGLLRGAFLLERSGEVLARAEKPSAFRRLFHVEHAGTRYTMAQRSILRRAFVLRRGDDDVGTLAPERLIGRRVRVELPDELPVPVAVFVIFLAVLLWKRASRSAGSGAAG